MDGSMRLHGEEQTSHEESSDEDTCDEETSPGPEALLLYLEIIIHSTAYMNGRATTRGVF